MSEESKRGQKSEAHRKAAREWAKRDYDKNREARVAIRKKWRHEHPEYVLLRNAKKRAKEKGLEFTLTAEDIHIPEVCPLLGIPIHRNLNGDKATPNSPTLDRIDSSKGYTKDNVWITSWRANKLKSDASLEELEKLVSGFKTKTPPIHHQTRTGNEGTMCTENKQDALAGVKSSLNYIREDVDSALSHAANVGDKVLTEKLTEIKSKAQGVKDYIAERTNSKTG